MISIDIMNSNDHDHHESYLHVQLAMLNFAIFDDENGKMNRKYIRLRCMIARNGIAMTEYN